MRRLAALALVLLAAAAGAPAQQAPAAPAAAWTRHDTEYSAKGADTCLKCHDAESDTDSFTTAGIFKGKHAQRGHAGSPFGKGGLQCEACHGPGGRHSASGSKKKLTTNSFKPDSFLPVAERNAACLSCHAGDRRHAMHDGPHARGDVACTDCHKLHTGNDPVRAKASQPEVCFTCHKAQRADFHKASAHPVKAGKMACSDCHNAHGGSGLGALLNKPTTLQACQSCHADKRGPFLWEHAPVAEDCTQCHTPHGSVRPALLAKSPPLLCQQCHGVNGHPAVARTGAALPAGGSAGAAAAFLVGGSCTNCHSQVHGSNHPAGSKLMR